jgi:hypothetical protein
VSRGLLVAELLRLKSSRVPRVLAGLTVFFVALSTLGNSSTQFHKLQAGQTTAAALSYFLVGIGSVSLLFAAISGAVQVTGEFRSRSIGLSALITPSRTPILITKSVVAAAAGAGFGLLGCATAIGVAQAWLGAHHHHLIWSAHLVALVLKAIAVCAAAGPWGVLVGALLRSSLLAVGALFVYTTMVEAALLHYFSAIGRWLPGGAQAAALADPSVPHRLGPLAGASVLLAWIVTLALIVIPSFRRSEI